MFSYVFQKKGTHTHYIYIITLTICVDNVVLVHRNMRLHVCSNLRQSIANTYIVTHILSIAKFLIFSCDIMNRPRKQYVDHMNLRFINIYLYGRMHRLHALMYMKGLCIEQCVDTNMNTS